MDKRAPLLLDTGFFLALGNVKDTFHKPAVLLLEKIRSRKWITTWPVLTETSHLLSKAFPREYHKLLKALEAGLCEIFSLQASHWARIHALTIKYQSLPMDLADASLVIAAEELQIRDIASTDQRDFNTYRWKNRLPFHNLLLS